MGHRLVIDTDIGTDVDDLWTLAMVPGLAGVDLEAVTLVYGDTDVRARLASVALIAMGIDVPLYRGCEQPLSGKAVVWAGHEGVGVPGLSTARSWAHDPLALLALAEPEWFTFTRMAVAVEADGRVRGTPDTASPVEVVTDLDPEGAHAAFLRSLGCAPAGPPRGLS